MNVSPRPHPVIAALHAADANADADTAYRDWSETSESSKNYLSSFFRFLSRPVRKAENQVKHIPHSASDIASNLRNIWERFAINKQEETIDIEEFLTRLSSNQKFSDDVHYRITGDIKLKNNALVALPKYLTVEGKFTIDQCPNLEAMPKDLCVTGNFVVEQCPKLEALSESLIALDGLAVRDCPIKNLGKSCSVGSFLSIKGCPHLEKLADNDLAILSYFELEDCPNLQNLGKKISTGNGFIIRNCDSIETLPDLDLSVGSRRGERYEGSFILENCNNITNVPLFLSNVAYMSIDNCPKLQNLGYGITVNGSVDISCCDALEGLCKTLKLGKQLRVKNCPKLDENKLENNLSCSLWLSKEFNIKNDLTIRNCQNLEKLCNKLNMTNGYPHPISFT